MSPFFMGKNMKLLLIEFNCWLEDKALQDQPPYVYESLFGFVTKFVDQIKKVSTTKHCLMVFRG